MARPKWPLKYRVWQFLHHIVNTLAWHFVPTTNYQDPKKNHWLWKLNNWVADHYTTWWATEGRKLK